MLAFVAGGFLITMLVLATVLGPKNKNRAKMMPFECGVRTTGLEGQRFSVKFYLVAMLFILFDIEVIFMYPWAIAMRDLGWVGFFEMFSFMLVLVVGVI